MMECKNKINKPYYVYILRCLDDSLYIGITPNIEHRIKAHLGIIKGGARYTKSHPVVKLEAAWKTESKAIALRFEYAMKRLPRQKKLSLINEPSMLCNRYLPDLSCYRIEFCTDRIYNDVLEKILKSRE